MENDQSKRKELAKSIALAAGLTVGIVFGQSLIPGESVSNEVKAQLLPGYHVYYYNSTHWFCWSGGPNYCKL